MPHGRTVLRTAAVAVVVTALGAMTAGAQSEAAPMRVVADLGAGRVVIDGHRGPVPFERQTLADLIDRWGPPARRRALGPTDCIAVWRSPRVVVDLANYGYRTGNACTPDNGKIQFLTTAGPAWRTSVGLRVGASEQAIRRLHPRAVAARRFGGRVWLLRPYSTPCIGDCGAATTIRTSGVMAKVRNGRVTSFLVIIGAAGE